MPNILAMYLFYIDIFILTVKMATVTKGIMWSLSLMQVMICGFGSDEAGWINKFERVLEDILTLTEEF